MTLGRVIVTYARWHGLWRWEAKDASGLVIKHGVSGSLEKAKAAVQRWVNTTARREGTTVTKDDEGMRRY